MSQLPTPPLSALRPLASLVTMAAANKSLSNILNPFDLDPLLAAGGLAALTAGVAYAGVCLALYRVQRSLIFRPLPTLLRTPADLGLPYEDVWIPAEDGGQLHAWWLPNHANGERSETGSSELDVLLFCHGNYGNISYNTERIRFFHSLGFSVLAFDYRGYGQSVSKSTPVPTEPSTFADAESAWHYLTQTRDIAPSRITTMGHSMGGAIAIHLAAQPIAKGMARLLVDSSFTRMEDAVRSRPIYRLFPIHQLLTEPFDSLSKVGQLTLPTLYVHGDQDFDVPMPMSKQLYAASCEPKRLWIAPGANHNNICTEVGDRYAEVIQSFCRDYPAHSNVNNTAVPAASAPGAV